MAGLGARGKQQVAVVSSTQPAIKTSCQAQECHSSMCSPSLVNFTEMPFCYIFVIVCNHKYYPFFNPYVTKIQSPSCALRVVVRKKTVLCGKNSQGAAPPPQFGKPLLSKKKLGLFFILEPQEPFWSSPKNHNSGPRENNCVGSR